MAKARAKSTNLFEEGVERTREVIHQIGEDFEEIQKRAEKRRKELEKTAERRVQNLRTELRKNRWVKEAEKRGKELEKRAEQRRKDFEKRAAKLRKDIEASAPVKRVQELRADAEKAFNEQVEALLENLRIASQTDFQKLERKVNGLQRKTVGQSELEKLERKINTLQRRIRELENTQAA